MTTLPSGPQDWGTPAPANRRRPQGDQLPTRPPEVVEVQVPPSPGPGMKPPAHKEVSIKREDMVLPEGVEPPTRGWPLWQWRLNRLLKRHEANLPTVWKVPAPNDKEQAERRTRDMELQARRDSERATGVFWVRMAWLITYLQALANTPDLVVDIATANIRGFGGKSTIALLLSDCVSFYGGKIKLILPSTLNTTVGEAGKMSAIPVGDRKTFSQVYEMLGKFQSARDVGDNIPVTSGNSFLISEDPNRYADANREYTVEQFAQVADGLYPHIYGGITFDMGNDSIAKGSIVFEVATRATVLVFCALAELMPSRDNMITTINGLRTAPDTMGSTRGGRFVSIQEKVAHSIVVVNGVRPGEVIDVNDFVVPKEQSANAVAQLPFKGRGMTTPFDATLDPRNKHITCSIHSIEKTTLLAVLEIAVECYKQGAAMLNISIDHLDGLAPNFDRASTLLGTNVRPYASYWHPGLFSD